MLPPFSLTADQQAAKEAFNAFLCDPFETVFVLEGYSGCGKSTLVETLLNELPDFMRMAKLINPDMRDYTVTLTATTNKAADNLSQITGKEVVTIQSALHLRVHTTYKNGNPETKLVPRDSYLIENCLLVVDEASKVDSELLTYTLTRTKNCKIVFVGDPAQLLNVGSAYSPVFKGKYSGAKLREVVRHTGPILALATQFRHTVETGEWLQFKPDGYYIQRLDRDAFMQTMLDEFSRPDWRYTDSKALSYTNKCAIGTNNFVRAHVAGNPDFAVGDYVVCNSFVTRGKFSLKTDQLVRIEHIGEEQHEMGAQGCYYTVNGMQFFMPKTLEERAKALKQAKAEDNINAISVINESWIDLRAAYAQTTDKSQGSTYGKVFIDLDDLSRCHNGDQLARMLYVSTSRARDHVFFTGDLA